MFLLVPWKLESPSLGKLNIPLANWILIAANVAFFLLGIGGAVSRGSSPLTILLYGFTHAGLYHLIVNMWLLWLFGNPMNRRLGNGLYVTVYLGTILTLGILARWMIHLPMVGSSGAIYALIAMTAFLEPRAVLRMTAIALFPLTAIIGFFAVPTQLYQWVVRWQVVHVPMLSCLVAIPLILLAELCWFGWNWGTVAHLLGGLCGVVAVLLLPSSITLRRQKFVTV